ncbi:MAG: alpha/beta hydrolase fold domain-containing protein [Nitrososphaeraceae archaeon]
MRDKGMGIPAALVVMSPNTDLTLQGDTYFTLNGSDPLLSDYEMLKHAADAYAEPSDRMNPYVSPVYGNFTKGFPPTLIQVGTKEVVLSDSIRLYQALDQANIPVKLDAYEGMPHVFQNQLLLYDIPESKISYSKMNDFFKQFLKY